MRRLLPLLIGALLLVACDDPTPNKTRQANAARDAANSIRFDSNAEIANIKRRLELTSNPGAVGYILLLNQSGQPIAYYGVKGKVTSSGKRLTPPDENDAGDIRAAPSDEGTFGSSDPYVYFWDSQGGYHQWSGEYLYSDRPIRLQVEPLVVTTR